MCRVISVTSVRGPGNQHMGVIHVANRVMLLGIVQWEVPRVVLTSERVRSDLYVVICFGCIPTFVV